MCDSKELLISFLYDEIDPAAKQAFQKHLAMCVECRDELAALGATRAQVALWTPPDADLGFRIVRGAESPARSWFRFSPAWGLAAAAMLLVAIGAAIANLDVRYGNDGLVVRTGWNNVNVAPPSVESNVTPVDWKAQADQLDRRLREIERTMSTRQSPPVQNASASDLSDADLLQRVREIVGQSETRQQRAFASRLADLTREFDAQRQLDLVAIDQGMTRLQNTSGAEVKQIREVMSRYVRQAAYQGK
jgi:hypothetical protein